MKLLELSTPKKSEQLSQIVESFFGKKLNVTALTVEQATSMLTKTQNLIKEVTNSTKFHSSEKNPAYLQALIIEQSLQAYLNEYGADQKNPYPEPIDTKQLTQRVGLAKYFQQQGFIKHETARVINTKKIRAT